MNLNQSPILNRAKDKNNNWAVGHYKREKNWQTNCKRCGKEDVKTNCSYESPYAQCDNCDEKYVLETDSNFETGYIGEVKHYIVHDGDDIEISDMSTLQISFDDGVTYDNIEDVARAVEMVKHQAKIWSEE